MRSARTSAIAVLAGTVMFAGAAQARDNESKPVSSRPTSIELCKSQALAGTWPGCKSGVLVR